MNKKTTNFRLTMLALLLLLSTALTAGAVTFTYNNVNFYITSESNKTCEVTSRPSKYSGMWVIPAYPEYNGVTYTCTAVGNSAFYDCTGLTSVTLPNTIISAWAFYGCTSLTSITIPASVTTIYQYAFEDCDGLTSVTIPSGVTSMSTGVFHDCDKLESVVWNSSMTTIPTRTFSSCDKLASFSFPHWITAVGEGAFNYTSLPQVILPYGLTTIGNSAFANNSALTTVLIPSSVTSVAASAFNYCTSLKTLYCNMATAPSMVFANVPSTCNAYCPVGKVDQYVAASGWKNLQLDAGAYDYNYGTGGYNATSLYHMTITSTTPVTYDGTTYAGTAKYVFHPNIMTTTSSGFSPALYEQDYMCSSGKRYLITEIGDSCFYNSSATIQSISFTNCDKLSKLGHDAFWTSNIKQLTLPASVTSYGKYALYYMLSLTDLYVNNPAPAAVPSLTFYYADQERATLHVPTQASLTAYKEANYWKKFLHITTDEPLIDYGVSVCGIAVTNANANRITGPGISGNVSYNPETNRILLQDATLSSEGGYLDAGISFNNGKNAKVYFEGNANVIGTSNKKFYRGIVCMDANLNVEGYDWTLENNSLSINTTDHCIHVYYDGTGARTLTLADASYNLDGNGNSPVYNYADESNLILENVNAKFNTSTAFYQFSWVDNLTLTDCYISQPAGGFWKTGEETGEVYGWVCNANGSRYLGTVIVLPGTSVVRGDVNGDGIVDVSDVSVLIDYLLSGNAAGVNLANADCDNNGMVDVSDLSALIDYLLSSKWAVGLAAPAAVNKDGKFQPSEPVAATAQPAEASMNEAPAKPVPADEPRSEVIATCDDKAVL